MKITLLLLVAFLVVSCSSASVNQKSGAAKLDAGNYADAVAALEAAKQGGDRNDELYLRLSEAKFKFAQEDFAKAQGASKYDVPNRVLLLTRAQESCQGSIAELKLLPADAEPGLRDTTTRTKLLGEITPALATAKEDRAKLTSQLTTLKKGSMKQLEATFAQCRVLAPYKEFVTELRDTCDTTTETLVKNLQKKGWTALDASKNGEAKKAFEKILSLVPDEKRGQEGLQCLKAREAEKKEDGLRESYAALLELKKTAPDSACLGKYEKPTLLKLIKRETSQAKTLSKEKNVMSALSAIDHYVFLTGLPGLSEEQKTAVHDGLAESRSAVARMLISKAKQLHSKGKDGLPLAWASLKYAWRFDPALTEKSRELAQEGLAFIKAKSEFRTLLDIKGRKEESFAALEARLKEKLVTPSSAADAEYTMRLADDVLRKPASGKKQAPEPYDYLLSVNLLDYKADEYGANQPFYQASRYVSGTQQLDNPGWFAAQNEYNAAQQEYNSSYAAYQQMINNCNNMNNALSAGFCKGAIQGISTSRVDNARNVLNATPRFVQQNVISDYSYRKYTVGVNVYMRIDYKLLDRDSTPLFPAKTVEYKVTRKEGVILEGVQPSDVNGLHDGRTDVPDLAFEKGVGHDKLAIDLQNELRTLAGAKRGMRYCQLGGGGKKKKKTRSETETLSSYQLCVLFTKGADSIKDKKEQEDLKTAQEKLDDFFELSAADLQKYALNESELPKVEAAGNPFLEVVK